MDLLFLFIRIIVRVLIHVELYTFFGGNNGEYVDYNGNTRSIKPGTAHLLEHYICENTVEGNLLDNLRKYNILSCNGGY